MAKAEAEIAQCEGELAVYKSAEESTRLSNRVATLRAESDTAMSEWEEISLVLEETSAST